MTVAPPAGAWIETWDMAAKSPMTGVAPPTGAWIETSDVTDIARLSAVYVAFACSGRGCLILGSH